MWTYRVPRVKAGEGAILEVSVSPEKITDDDMRAVIATPTPSPSMASQNEEVSSKRRSRRDLVATRAYRAGADPAYGAPHSVTGKAITNSTVISTAT